MSTDHLFTFSNDYTLAMLFTFVPSLINLGIFIYVWFNLPRNKTNNTFSFFVILLCLWQSLEGFSHICSEEQAALVWYRMSSSLTIGVVVFETLFALRYTGWQKKFPLYGYYIFLYVPAILFVMLLVGGLDEYSMSRSDVFGWIATPKNNLFMDVLYGWISIVSIFTLFLFIIYWFKAEKNDTKRHQSLLLSIGFLIPIVGGIFGEVIAPLFIHSTTIPITTPLVTAFSFTSLIAIKKYGSLDFSPRHHWENILKSMNEGLVISDLEGKIMYANNAFSYMSGYSLKELKGTLGSKLMKDDTSKIKLELAIEERKKDAIRNAKLTTQNQYLITRKDGSSIWLTVNSFPYLDHNGKTIGTVGISTDITELMETQEKLKAKINELNLFFYKTSHDFKTPIASLQGLLDIYQKGDDIDETLNYIKQCTENLSLIVGRVSQLSLIQQRQLKYSNIECREELNKIIDELKSEIPKDGALEINLDLQTETIYSEVFLIRLIFKNLIENAMKYFDKDKEKCIIKISISQSVENYIIRISDNGEGISAEIQPKIFEMFYRGNERSKGSGLGLYVVKSAAEKLNGNIAVRSKLKEGTEFILQLPVLSNP